MPTIGENLDAKFAELDGKVSQNETKIAALEARVTALEAAPEPEPEPEPDPGIDPRRPYGPNAPWNIPTAQVPVHPTRNKELCDLLWNDVFTDRPQRNFNINYDAFTYPVYEVKPGMRSYPVVSANPSWGNLHGKTIPFDPSWKPAPGSDAQIIILDPPTGREWNLHKVNFDGSTVYINNGNLIPGSYWTREEGFASSRGVGIQYLAMLVRPWEIEKGKIEHCLSMPALHTSGIEFFPPATKIEHEHHPYGIPEGARYSLDVTDAEIDAHLASLPCRASMKPGLRTIMVAMRDYGWIITDTSGSNHIQLEDRTTAAAAWDALGFAPEQIGTRQFPRDALDGLMTRARLRAHVDSTNY